MDENLNKQYETEFTKPIIKYGRFINLLSILLCFVPALVMWFVFDAKPPTEDILKGWGLIASIFLIYAIIEPISYFPVFGLAGTYIGCLSGNIGNVRVPASAIAQQTLGTTPGTKKAELVSTLGICGSVVTNLAFTTLAAFAGAWIMGLFPPIVIEAFNYVSPAIFGAMFGMNAIKNPKYGVFAFIVGFILMRFFTLPAYVLVPAMVFSTVAFGFIVDGRK